MLTRKQIESDIYSVEHDNIFSVYVSINLKNTEIAFKFQFSNYERLKDPEILTNFLMNFSKNETKFNWWIDLNIEKLYVFADKTIVNVCKFSSYDSSFLLESL